MTCEMNNRLEYNMAKLEWGEMKTPLERMSENNLCGGMHQCENRTYDSKMSDCQECMEDYDSAMGDFD